MALAVKHISEKRLQPYLQLAHLSQEKALELYRLDRKLASAIFEDIAYLEVALRNNINQVLCEDFGNDWYCRQIGFDERVVRNIADTWEKLPAQYTSKSADRNSTLGGRIVASSMFRTWTNMLDAGGSSGLPAPFEKSHHGDIWTRDRLIRVFPGANQLAKIQDPEYAARGLHRAWVHEKVLYVHWLRNRAAHHESLVNGIPKPGDSGGKRIIIGDCLQHCTDLAVMLDRELYSFLEQESKAQQILESIQGTLS